MLDKLIVKAIPLMPRKLIWAVGKKYIAGLTFEDAVNTTKQFAKLNGGTTIDVLGEFVSDKERAIKERDSSLRVLETIKKENLPTYLSIKPTSNGLGIDPEFGYENVKMLVERANNSDFHAAWIWKTHLIQKVLFNYTNACFLKVTTTAV